MYVKRDKQATETNNGIDDERVVTYHVKIFYFLMDSGVDVLGELVAANKVAELREICDDFKDLILNGRNFKIRKEAGARERLVLPCDSLSLLHIAAFYDNFEMLLYLESLGIPLDVQSGGSYYPFHYACAGAAIECVAYLLSMVPEQAVLAADCQWQPILLATSANSPEILQMLLDYGANVRSKHNADNHPFEQAIKCGNVECLLLLLTHKCKTDITCSGLSPLMLLESRQMGQSLEPLLDMGLDPYFVSFRGETVLSIACISGDLPSVKLLCNRMIDIEIPCSDNMIFSSIARYAVTSNNIEILRTVLEKGCDVNRYDSSDDLPADAIRGPVDDELGVKMLDLLVQNGFDINCRSPKTRKSFLDRVVEYTIKPYPRIVEYLLTHDADVSTKLQDGKTLLEKVNAFTDKSSRYNGAVLMLYRDIFKRHFPDEIE